MSVKQDASGPVLSLYEEFLRVAGLLNDTIAIAFAGEELTYRQVREKVDATADVLRALGVSAGTAYAIYGRNCPDFLYGYLAAAKIGAVFVPINSNVTLPEVEYILEHSSAEVMFFDDFVTNVASTPSLAHLAKPIQVLREVESAQPALNYGKVEPSSDLLIVYTSGSTGKPKAVALSHAAQIRAAEAMADLWSFSNLDSTVVAAPMGFLLGLSTASVVPLLAGIKLVINKRFHPGEVLDALVKSKASVFHGVPTMYSMMLDYAEQQGKAFDLSEVRVLICSGAPMPEELAQRFLAKFGKAPQNYFGMTECYPLVGTYSADGNLKPQGAVGRLAPGAEVKFVDEHGQPCSPGQPGEMYARAASVLTRYHKDPQLTQESLVDGWFKTGDAGYLSDGYVYITGRLKDLIIRGGANIAPLEVEIALLKHPAVQSASVVGVPDRLYGEVPVAFIVLNHGTEASEEELIQFSKNQLADFKVPTRIVFRAELPLGKTSKIDKIQLKKIWQGEIACTAR